MNSEELLDLENLLWRFRNEFETHWTLAIDEILKIIHKERMKKGEEESERKGITRRSPF
jgi:ATP-dependent protease HslVU (ClpYQ) ATPase subunit